MLEFDKVYIDGIDIYSSVLWHLNMEHTLSSICHFMGKWAPEAKQVNVPCYNNQ